MSIDDLKFSRELNSSEVLSLYNRAVISAPICTQMLIGTEFRRGMIFLEVKEMRWQIHTVHHHEVFLNLKLENPSFHYPTELRFKLAVRFPCQ